MEITLSQAIALVANTPASRNPFKKALMTFPPKASASTAALQPTPGEDPPTQRECDHGATYLPKVGDAIYARRIRRSKIYQNMVIGPVVDTWDNACRVVTNPGTESEGDFRLHYNEWTIRPVFTEEFPPPNDQGEAQPPDKNL